MTPKGVVWMGSSLDDLRECPEEVRAEVGHALWFAQNETPHSDMKILRGFGGGVLEIVTHDRSDTYRTIYTVRFSDFVYVLHVFQKKSKSGIATPRQKIELVKTRLKTAEIDYAERCKTK